MKKSMLYKRLFFTYVVVIILVIIIFDCYLINSLIKNEKENKLLLGEKLVYDINDSLNEIENSNSYIVKSMYYDQMVTKDILSFLKKDINSYFKEKLNYLSENNEFNYQGTEAFITRAFISNENINSISLLNLKDGTIRNFNKLNQIEEKKIDMAELINLPNIVADKGYISYLNDINNIENLEKEGKLIITYKLNSFDEKVKKYGEEHSVLILDKDGNNVYKSREELNFELNPNWGFIHQLEEYKNKRLNNNTNLFKIISDNQLNIVGETSLTNLLKDSKKVYNSILCLDIILFVISISILKNKLEKFNNRTNKLLTAMNEVKEGNLKTLIEIGPLDNEKDEISYISEHFNEMCKSLDEYISVTCC